MDSMAVLLHGYLPSRSRHYRCRITNRSPRTACCSCVECTKVLASPIARWSHPDAEGDLTKQNGSGYTHSRTRGHLCFTARDCCVYIPDHRQHIQAALQEVDEEVSQTQALSQDPLSTWWSQLDPTWGWFQTIVAAGACGLLVCYCSLYCFCGLWALLCVQEKSRWLLSYRNGWGVGKVSPFPLLFYEDSCPLLHPRYVWPWET